MHVAHTAAEPPNHGTICLAMIGWTRNSRKAPRKLALAYKIMRGPWLFREAAILTGLCAALRLTREARTGLTPGYGLDRFDLTQSRDCLTGCPAIDCCQCRHIYFCHALQPRFLLAYTSRV